MNYFFQKSEGQKLSSHTLEKAPLIEKLPKDQKDKEDKTVRREAAHLFLTAKEKKTKTKNGQDKK
jgi:hypothetical protein